MILHFSLNPIVSSLLGSFFFSDPTLLLISLADMFTFISNFSELSCLCFKLDLNFGCGSSSSEPVLDFLLEDLSFIGFRYSSLPNPSSESESVEDSLLLRE